jgi:hypothetical protein
MEIRKAERTQQSSRLGEPPGNRRRRDQAMMICGFTERVEREELGLDQEKSSVGSR